MIADRTPLDPSDPSAAPTLEGEIDDLIAQIEGKKAEFDSAVATSKRELELGKTGLDAYLRAKALKNELALLCAEAGQKIDAALKVIGP